MEVKVTGHSHSAQSTLHYIYYGNYKLGKGAYNLAHRNPNGIQNRNEMIFGINCHRSYRGALNNFKHYLRQKPHNKVQTLNVVLSFDKKDFNFNNKEDCFEASEIASNFIHQAFPNHQAIVALQHDNKNNIPHIHCVMNAISMEPPYKTINGKYYGIGRLRSIGKDCVKDYEKQFNRKISSITHHTGKGYQKPNRYQQVVINALRQVMNNPQVNSPSKLRNALKPYGIQASFKRRGTRRKRRRKRNRGRRYQRSGLVFKYITKQNGKKRNHYCRASRLADVNPKYSYKNVIRQLTDNKVTLHKQRAEVKARKQARRVRQQRKEQINHERRRLSEQAHERLVRMARVHQQRHRQIIQQSEALPEAPKPMFVRMANGDNDDSDTGKKDTAENRSSAEEQRSQRSRQGNASPVALIFSNLNQIVERIKRFQFKAKIKWIKRRIAQAITKRIARIRTKIEQRVRNIEDRREAKIKRKRYQRWQREQGGPEL